MAPEGQPLGQCLTCPCWRTKRPKEGASHGCTHLANRSATDRGKQWAWNDTCMWHWEAVKQRVAENKARREAELAGLREDWEWFATAATVRAEEYSTEGFERAMRLAEEFGKRLGVRP